MELHPLSRHIFSKMSLIGPIRKALLQQDIQVDLSNNTNAYLGELAEYPDVLQSQLKENVAAIFSKLNPWDSDFTPLSGDQILFTVGSCEGIDLLLRAFCEPNQDTILVLNPSFPAYEHWAQIHNLKVERIPFQDEDYQRIDLEAALKTPSKMIFLCSPNNPTGTVLDNDDILNLCDRYPGIIVVDEAYVEFSTQSSWVHKLKQYPNLVVLRTFSKAWGLAAIRSGTVIADPRIIYALRYIQIPFGFSQPSQDILCRRLGNLQEIMKTWDITRQERDSLRDKLMTLSCVRRILPSESNFLCIQLNSFKAIIAHLKERGIFVVDCSQEIPSSIRVTIGTREQNQLFFEILSLINQEGSYESI